MEIELMRGVLEARMRQRFEATIKAKSETAARIIEELCASPIERRIACEFSGMTLGFGGISYYKAVNYPWQKILDDAQMPPGLCLFFQPLVGKYRADFIVAFSDNNEKRFVAVECDGHDFHEKTKEQAEHDRRRDRFFQHVGLPVFRFTGAEIFRDATKCVREVERFLSAPRYLGA